MQVLVADDTDGVSTQIADIIEQAVIEKPTLTVALATGRTASRGYHELVRRHNRVGGVSYRWATFFNTDEYVGLEPGDSSSTRYFLNYHFYRHIDVPMENTYAPCGHAADIDAECKAYDLLIKARGHLDVVVLGLGYNGHVGFNEPGSSIKSRTRAVDFTESTLAALSDGYRFKNLTETPSSAVAMGLATLMEARHVIIVATGIGKADAVHRILDCNKGTTAVPASQLTTNHPNLTVVVDRFAASRIQTPLQELNTP